MNKGAMHLCQKGNAPENKRYVMGVLVIKEFTQGEQGNDPKNKY